MRIGFLPDIHTPPLAFKSILSTPSLGGPCPDRIGPFDSKVRAGVPICCGAGMLVSPKHERINSMTAPAKLRMDDPAVAKAVVVAEFMCLVEEGRAAMAMLEAGTLEMRLANGEIFHLGEETVTRVA
jgi:hypothetical protein